MLRIKQLFNPSIDDSIEDLLKYTNSIYTHSNVSSEGKDLIHNMNKHIEELNKVKNPKTSKQIVNVALGAIICVLAFEDHKYGKNGNEGLYPGKSLSELNKLYRKETGIDEINEIAFMNWVGTKARSNEIPFNSNIFKTTERTRFFGKTEQITIFPELKTHPNTVDKVFSAFKLPHSSYVSGFIKGAAMGFFEKLEITNLGSDVACNTAKYFNSQDAISLALTCKDVTFFAKKIAEKENTNKPVIQNNSTSPLSKFLDNIPFLKK